MTSKNKDLTDWEKHAVQKLTQDMLEAYRIATIKLQNSFEKLNITTSKLQNSVEKLNKEKKKHE